MSSLSPRSIVFALLTLCFLSQAHARWGDPSGANVECLSKDMTITVNKDGTWTVISDLQLKVLTEAGRQALSTQTLTYDATRNTAEILHASTNNNGQEFAVPKARIEDKPLASDSLGLKKDHQILLPFDRVTVGSVLHLKLKETYIKPDFEKFFSTGVYFDNGYLWDKVNITIDSAFPLLVNINDPRDSLNVQETKNASKHTVNITLKKPIYEQLVGESDHFFGEPALYTSVFVSTESDFMRLAKLEAAFYQPTLKAALPEELEKIRVIASKIDNEVECIDTIVSQLIGRITYLGNWNIAEGHLTPRSLEAIIKSGSGDCKEYASCLTAILNKLGRGYTANIAIVERGEVYIEEMADQKAYKRRFNHAIVKVVAPSGKTYWVDPTNNISMAEGIFPDIADRPALVLDPKNPTHERIPPVDYRHAKLRDERTLTLSNDGILKTEGSVMCEGESAKYFTESLKMSHPSVLKEGFVRLLCGSGEPLEPCISLPEKASHTVKPFKTTFSYGEQHAMIHTNHGDAYSLTSNWHKAYVSAAQTHEGALYVGHPETLVKKRLFKDVTAKDMDKLAFSIQTPWVNAKRELFVTKEGVLIVETIEKLKSVISAKDLKSKEYGKLKEALRKYCEGVSIVLAKK